MMTRPPIDESDIVAVGHTIARLGLVTAFGHVSVRIDRDSYRITAPGDLGELQAGQTVVVDLTAAALPPGAPPEAWLHTAIYRARPDAGAVVRAQPTSTFAVAAINSELKPLHGQGAWVADRVPVHPVPRLCRTEELATAAALTLGSGNAMLLRANGAVCVGNDPALAATRMWLLEVMCDVWLRAASVTDPVVLEPEDAEAWEAAGAPLLPRLWQHLQRSVARPSNR